MKKTKAKAIILILITIINLTPLQANAAVTSENNYETKSEQTIPVTDIDLGDYQKEMQVGENQLLNITLIPTNATNGQITYTSENTTVAQINAIGRITAQAVGQTIITIKAENIEKNITITVKEKEEEQTIPVTDIQISQYQEEMDVGKTQTITATVIPANATDQTITYTTSNSQIAQINTSGTITAKSKGTTTITIKSGKIKKELSLTVKIPTTSIQVDETYLVIKPGQTKQLNAKITPKEADQNLTYTVTDEKIITINSSGLITAQAIGRSSVIIKNKDMQKIVTVIINKEGSTTAATTGKKTQEEQVLSAYTDEIIEQMTNTQEDEITIEGNGEEILTKETLKYLSDNKKPDNKQ